MNGNELFIQLNGHILALRFWLLTQASQQIKKPLVYFPFIANETKVTASDDWRNLALDVWKQITIGITHGQSSLAKRNHWHNIITEISGVSTQLRMFTFRRAFRTILNQQADHWMDGKFFKRHRITQIQSSLSWLPSTAWPSIFVCCKACVIRKCFQQLIRKD